MPAAGAAAVCTGCPKPAGNECGPGNKCNGPSSVRLFCAGGSSSASGGHAASSGLQKWRKARTRPKTSRRPASPGSQRTPPRVSSPIGQACRSDWTACCGLTCSRHLVHRQMAPSGTNECTAGATCQAAPPQGLLANSLALEVSPALRPHLWQAHAPGTLPYRGATVPGKGQGPTGRRSCTPSDGDGLLNTASMAFSWVGNSWTLAWKSRSHDRGASAPSAAAAAAAAAG